MLGRILEISTNNKYISKSRGFIEISENKTVLLKIPFDDVLAIIVTGKGTSHSSNVIAECATRGIPFVICGNNYAPVAYMLAVDGHHRQSERFKNQICASEPLKKSLWKSVVQNKIKNQSEALYLLNITEKSILNEYGTKVRSGDTTNIEAIVANKYWKYLFSKNFIRKDDTNTINGMLNYGYAVIRSMVARSVVGAGLHPTLGIHHISGVNPMCLVDDLMEPFRPVVDICVWQLYHNGYTEIDTTVKKILCSIPALDIDLTSETRALFNASHEYCTHLTKIYAGQEKKLFEIPLPNIESLQKIMENNHIKWI